MVKMNGNIIFKKGESGELMYEIMSGSVGIYLHYKEEGERLLTRFGITANNKIDILETNISNLNG